MFTFTKTVLMCIFILFMGLSAFAAPGLMEYQGYLEDAGNPVTDTLSMDFLIYDAATGGNEKWSETQSSVGILGGLFKVTLGSVTAIPDTVFNNDT
ncbi:MAG: hypothetical protein ABIJ12_10370, partial [bacterium]